MIKLVLNSFLFPAAGNMDTGDFDFSVSSSIVVEVLNYEMLMKKPRLRVRVFSSLISITLSNSETERGWGRRFRCRGGW